MTILPSHSARTRDSAAHAVLVGLGAAWRTPSVIANDFAALLVASTNITDESAADAPVDAGVLTAYRALRLLSQVQPSRWRATCLYRSVAECLVLRALGRPARVVIGVGNGAAPAATIAHAWVECAGVRCRSTRGAADLETLAAMRA